MNTHKFRRAIEGELEGTKVFSPGLFHEDVINEYGASFCAAMKKFGFGTEFTYQPHNDELNMELQERIVADLRVDWVGRTDGPPTEVTFDINTQELVVAKRYPGDETKEEYGSKPVTLGQDVLEKMVLEVLFEFAEKIKEAAS